MSRELISTRKFKAGYEIRTEKLGGNEYGMADGESFLMKSAFTPSGDYIGNPKDAYQLVVKRSIKPEKAADSHSVCSIGFSEKTNKWYGWSHRAIVGFGIGDKLFEEVMEGADDETPFIQHGVKTIETLDEARQAAVNFANYVS